MSRRALRSVAAVIVACAVPGAAAAATGGATVSVRPRTVGPHTNVTASFRQPVPTGLLSDQRIVEGISVSGPTRAGCADTAQIVFSPPDTGALVRRTFRPARMTGGRWCLGRYTGRVTLAEFPRCTGSPVRACPEYVIVPRPIAVFSFRVIAR